MLKRYFELGFSVIPVLGKSAVVSDWSRWCLELPPHELVDEWERRFPFPKYGVALCAGPASNIDALDIDSDSEDILELCPRSPLSRVGARGEMRLFRHDPATVKRKRDRDNQTPNEIPKATEGVQVLSTGNYLVLPPSLHPDTRRPYVWLGDYSLENFSPLDLETLPARGVENVCAYIASSALTRKHTHGGELGEGGRNAKLAAMCCAILASDSEKSDADAAAELTAFDAEEHKPPYFSDPREMYFRRASTPFARAMLFVAGSRKRMLGKGLISPPVTRVAVASPPLAKAVAFPPLPGVMGAIRAAVLRLSRSRQEELATGAAIAICSALASNRFHIEGRAAITHQYILNVARSGQGKGAGFTVATSLFGTGELEKYNLIGIRNYSSNASIVGDLPLQRSRLDMVDEFGAVLKGFSSGSDIKKETEALICELYTANGSYWTGHKTATSGAKGACYAPAVSLFGNIQEETLVASANSSMIASGFLSRFMFFSANDTAEHNPHHLDPFDFEPIALECARLFPWSRLEATLPDGSVIADPGRIEPRRHAMIYAVGAKEHLMAIDAAFYAKEVALGDCVEAVFMSRYLQIAQRLAITMAVCCDRREITKDDIDCALALVTEAARRSNVYLSSIGGDSVAEKKMRWAVRYLTKVGEETHSKMLWRSHMDAQAFKKMMQTLEQSGQVTPFVKHVGSAVHYRLS